MAGVMAGRLDYSRRFYGLLMHYRLSNMALSLPQSPMDLLTYPQLNAASYDYSIFCIFMQQKLATPFLVQRLCNLRFFNELCKSGLSTARRGQKDRMDAEASGLINAKLGQGNELPRPS